MVAFARAFVCAVCVSAFAADNNSHDNNRLCYVNYVKRVQSTSSANSFLCIFYDYLWGIGANGMAVVAVVLLRITKAIHKPCSFLQIAFWHRIIRCIAEYPWKQQH